MAYNTGEIILIIGAATTAITAVVGAIFSGIALARTGRVETKVGSVETKVDKVEVQTNSRLTALDERLKGKDKELTDSVAALSVVTEQYKELTTRLTDSFLKQPALSQPVMIPAAIPAIVPGTLVTGVAESVIIKP